MTTVRPPVLRFWPSRELSRLTQLSFSLRFPPSTSIDTTCCSTPSSFTVNSKGSSRQRSHSANQAELSTDAIRLGRDDSSSALSFLGPLLPPSLAIFHRYRQRVVKRSPVTAMSEQIQIDAGAFQRRVKKLLSAWKDTSDDFEQLRDVDSLLVVMGGQNDDLIYSKTTAIHSWLLGYEFPSTVILFTMSVVTFVTSASKAVHLEALKKSSNGFDLDVLKRSKDEASNRAIWMTSSRASTHRVPRSAVCPRTSLRASLQTSGRASSKRHRAPRTSR